MGGIILLMVAGVAAGAVMAVSPRRIWWVTESWKFRNPEANEPSDTAYELTRAGGVLLILFALIFGGVLIVDHGKRAKADESKRAAAQAAAAFRAPPAEKRGALPVIGYFAEELPNGIRVTAYFLAPGDAVRSSSRALVSAVDSHPCYTSAGVITAAGNQLIVAPELLWEPEEFDDMSEADRCRLGVGRTVHEVFVPGATADTKIITDSAIVDAHGTEIHPAAPGNVVPQLAEELHTDP